MRRLLSLAATAMLAVSGVDPTQAANMKDMTPALQELVAAANKEGKLLAKFGGDVFGGAPGAKVIARHMEEELGAKIDIKWTPGGAMPEIGNEVALTFRNKQPSPTDVFVGFSRNFGVYIQTNLDMFQEAPWKTYMPDRLNDHVVEMDKFIKVWSSTTGFAYNHAQSKSKPERYEDFLKPEWKGKIGTTPFAAGFDQIAAPEAWGPTRTIAFAEKFAGQVGGFMRCTDAERVASGEFLAFVTDCGGGQMIQEAKKGAPITRVLSPDVPLVSFFSLAVPKNATNSNAAKLFIVYMLSKRGQKDQLELSTTTDLHLFEDSHIRKELVAAEKKYGITFKHADIAWQLRNDAGNAAQQKVAEILRTTGKR